jgi:hypothetical protein
MLVIAFNKKELKNYLPHQQASYVCNNVDAATNYTSPLSRTLLMLDLAA